MTASRWSANPWSRIVTGLLLLAGASVLSIGVAVRLAGLQFQTVVSNSMQPTFSAGDVVVTRPVPVGSVRLGDVIVFRPPGHAGAVIHRVTSSVDGLITTRGDANGVDDPWRIRLAGDTTYRLVAVVPAIGWLTQLQRPLLLGVGVLVVLTIVLELAREVRRRGKARTSVSNRDPSVHPE